jgi:hypothetical protein
MGRRSGAEIALQVMKSWGFDPWTLNRVAGVAVVVDNLTGKALMLKQIGL